MRLARVAPLEQPAVVEEDVHELPKHVVERLHEFLADRGVLARRLELPLRAGRRERERQAAALAREPERGIGVGAEADHDVARLQRQSGLLVERTALAGERQRR